MSLNLSLRTLRPGESIYSSLQYTAPVFISMTTLCPQIDFMGVYDYSYHLVFKYTLFFTVYSCLYYSW